MNSKISVVGAIIISVIAMLTFLGCLVLAYAHHDTATIGLLVGAVITMATTTVSFWLGSSMGSQKKDERLLPPTTAPPPADTTRPIPP